MLAASNRFRIFWKTKKTNLFIEIARQRKSMTIDITTELPIVNLLWTGGWDSTFRLLQLCQSGRVFIQPHYIIDWERGSHQLEMKTMERIRARILERYPVSQEMLKPTIFTKIEDIPRQEDIRAGWRQLYNQAPLGSQYYWLPEYAISRKIKGLEMSITGGEGRVCLLLREHCVLREIPGIGMLWCLSEKIGPDSANYIFHDFYFPVLGLTKPKMQAHATERGFLDILNLSWFCFFPIDGEPCGCCNPCKCAIESGMAHRVNLQGLKRYRLKKREQSWRKVWNILQKCTGPSLLKRYF
jgi:hypothetical protein